jgi:hypothetical protein
MVKFILYHEKILEPDQNNIKKENNFHTIAKQRLQKQMLDKLM